MQQQLAEARSSGKQQQAAASSSKQQQQAAASSSKQQQQAAASSSKQQQGAEPGATVAVPFSLGRHQVHFEGTIASILPSTSEVTVAFPGERPWVAARDRLFAVVARRSVASEDDDG